MNQEATEFAESNLPFHVPASLVRDIGMFNVQSVGMIFCPKSANATAI
jgi:hypothetical protein